MLFDLVLDAIKDIAECEAPQYEPSEIDQLIEEYVNE